MSSDSNKNGPIVMRAMDFQLGQFTASYFFLFLQSTEQTEEVALHRQLCGLSWHCAFKAKTISFYR